MRKDHISLLLPVSLAASLFVFGVSREAAASTCTNSSACVSWTQNGFGNALVGNAGSSGNYGVEGTATAAVGVYGGATTGYGVEGTASGAGGIGVVAVGGTGSGSYGVSASSSGAAAVYGVSTGGAGIHGSTSASGFAGVLGQGTSGSNGVEGECSGTGCYAGYFTGNVDITGSNCLYFNGTSYHCGSSDERLKKDVTQLTGVKERILKLRGVSFNWKNPDAIGRNQTGMQRGFIAQEVEKIFPEWVSENEAGTKVLTIPPDQFFALMVETARAEDAENRKQNERLDRLEERSPRVAMNAASLLLGFGFFAATGAVVYTRKKRNDAERS
jgi:hypothetical protein